MPELELGPPRAGISDDFLQAIVKTIKRMTIAMLKRFTKNLLFLINILFDGVLVKPLIPGVWEKEGRRYPPVGLWEEWENGSEGLVEELESRNERSEWRLSSLAIK